MVTMVLMMPPLQGIRPAIYVCINKAREICNLFNRNKVTSRKHGPLYPRGKTLGSYAKAAIPRPHDYPSLNQRQSGRQSAEYKSDPERKGSNLVSCMLT